MATQPTSKHTKNEILGMYAELLKEKQQLEAQVRQMQKAQPSAVQQSETVVAEPSVIMAPTAPSTLDGIIKTLSVLRPGFGDAVSELSAKLIAEASKLQEIRNEVTGEILQLETLHDLQVTDGSLDLLIREFREKSDTFGEEARESRERLEKEMAENKKDWQQEQSEKAHFIKERDDGTKKQEQREAAEYKYDLELRRKLEFDLYEQEQAALKEALDNFEAGRKKEWEERENRISEQEIEWTTLQAQIEKFPKELDAASKKSQDAGAKIARRQTQIQADLRAKDVEGERRSYELKIHSFEDAIAKQTAQIDALSAQLNAAAQQAQALAMKAIEGASSSGSFQAVKEIALEQAKNIPKGTS